MADASPLPALPTGPLPSGLVTFMFTDIVNSTRLKGLMPGETSGERQDNFHEQIKLPHARIIFACVGKRKGVIVEGTGDGFFIAFPDAELGVLCGLEIQEQLKAANIPTPDGTLQVRIGLNSGTATPTGLGYTSSAADKAARVQSQAGPGLVYLSPETHGFVTGKVTSLAYADLGPVELKGLGPVTLYQAFRKDQSPNDTVADAYRKHLVDRFGKLTLYSLSSDQPIAVDLEQVFVKLTTFQQFVEHKASLAQAFDDFRDTLNALDAGEFSRKSLPSGFSDMISSFENRGLSVEEVKFVWPGKASAGSVRVNCELTLSLPEALRAHPHLALIGAPGAGKTTALKWLALAYARRQVKERLALEEDRLPLFVALRDFNRFLDNLDGNHQLPGQLPPALLARHLQEYYAEHVAHLALPADFFLRALATGKALVLLDGLDEVAVASKRTRAAEFVAACVRAYPGCRFVLSSRPRGYENDCRTHLAALCSECRVRDFDDDDIAAFSRNWYLAVTIAREGDNPTTRDRAETAAKNLQAAVKQERVRPLAANPLLLSILARIHQQGVGLPERRVELYQKCTEFLLGYWDATEKGDVGRELAELGGWDINVRRKLLEPIALWMHERGGNRTEVHRDELVPKLADQFQRYFSCTPEQATLRAEEFVNVITLRTGLLLPKEENVFEFAHPTFREYFAACALMGRKDYVPTFLAHLHDPWWNEVHLLGIGHIGTGQDDFVRERVQIVLEAIRGAGSWLEADLHRDLLFAFQALCDVGQLGVDDAYRRELAEVVLTLFQKSQVHPLKDRIRKLLSYAGVTPVGTTLVESVLSMARSQTDFTRLQATEALGLLGAAGASPAALDRLVSLTKDNNFGVQSTAIRALGHLGPSAATVSVIDLLSSLLRSDNFSVKGAAIDAIGLMGAAAAREEVLAYLFTLLSSKDLRLNNPAGIAFGRIVRAVGKGVLLTELLDLTKHPDDSIRGNAVCDLVNLPPEAFTEQIIARLLELTSDKHDTTRLNATAGLSKLRQDQISEAILSRLIELTQDDVDGVRSNAAGALRQLSTTDSIGLMLAKLLAITRSEDHVVLRRAIEVLGLIGTTAANESVIARLLELTHDDDPTVKEHAVRALGKLGAAAANDGVVNRIAALARDDSVCLRWFASEALGNLGPRAASHKVINCLLAGMADSEEVVRETAVQALGNLGIQAATPQVLTKLTEVSKSGQGDMKWRAGMALGRMLGKLNKAQTEVLVRFCMSYMTSAKEAKLGREFRAVSEFAFDTLNRLATLQPRTQNTAVKRSKTKGKTGRRAPQPKRAKKK